MEAWAMDARLWTVSTALVALTAGAVLAAGPHRGAEPDATQDQGLSRLMQVKVWRLRVTFDYGLNNVVTKEETNVTETQTTSETLIAQVDFRLVKAKTFDSKHWNWHTVDSETPSGRMTAAGDFMRKFRYHHDGHEEWTRQQFKTAGVKGGEAAVRIDSESGAIMVSGGFEGGGLTHQVTTHQGDLPKTEVPATMFLFPSMGEGYWQVQAPEKGLVVKSDVKLVTCLLPFQRVNQPIVNVRWTLSPWDQEPPGEASFEYVDKNWYPDPKAPCAINIKWKGMVEKIRATLSDISHEPGTCLNSDSKSDDDDLKLEGGSGWTVLTEGDKASKKYVAMHLVPKKGEETTTLNITATDYGAWGKLHVEVFQDGKWQDAKQTSTGKGTTNVPYDLDGNHVADHFEDEYGVKGQSGDADDDGTPAGTGQKGDGLTLYEEYRGFMENGEHIRTNPTVKDLFLSDQTGGRAQEGANRFERASKVRVHTKMTAQELSEGRVINRNWKDGPHKTDQHGIPVVEGAEGSDAEAVPVDKKKGFGPPVMTAKISLPPAPKDAKASGESDSEGVSVVAHEIGHSVGLRHHDENVAYVVWTKMTGADGKPHFYECALDPATGKVSDKLLEIHVFRESTGVEVTDSVKPFGWYDDKLGAVKILLAVCGADAGAPQHSQYSGQDTCFMRYGDANAYIPISNANGFERWIPDTAEHVVRDQLCSSKAGTGINAPDHKPWPRYGDAITGGNCKAQIVVNDKFAK